MSSLFKDAAERKRMGTLPEGRRNTEKGAPRGSSAEAGTYFELSCQSPAQLAALLRARHGLTDLKAMYDAFRGDPGEELHPDRVSVSSDGFALTSSNTKVPLVDTGWIVMECLGEGGDGYSRMRSFVTFKGALAEFCAKLDLNSVGSLEVAEGDPQRGRAQLRFGALSRTMSLVFAG